MPAIKLIAYICFPYIEVVENTFTTESGNLYGQFMIVYTLLRTLYDIVRQVKMNSFRINNIKIQIRMVFQLKSARYGTPVVLPIFNSSAPGQIVTILADDKFQMDFPELKC